MTRVQTSLGLAGAARLGRRCWQATFRRSAWVPTRPQLRWALAGAVGGMVLVTLQLLPAWSVGYGARLANGLFQKRPWQYWHLGYGALAADRPSAFRLCWRERGRNEFGEERCCRLALPPGAQWQPLTIPVNDTVSEFRIYLDDQPCVFELGQLALLVRPAAGQRLLSEYGEPDVAMPLAISESQGVKWEEGTATCANATINEPPYFQFTLKHPAFVRAVRLTYAYPAAAGPNQFCIFWREQGRNDFAEERSCRLKLTAGAQGHSVTIPVRDTVTDLRIYPDDTQRPGGYACVFRLDQLRLLVGHADRERLGQELQMPSAWGFKRP